MMSSFSMAYQLLSSSSGAERASCHRIMHEKGVSSCQSVPDVTSISLMTAGSG